MQFTHPSILYFLGLLIIPIIIHLFQLQKFKKVTFTNVAFLQKIQAQTRKSSRIKKWLILATRLLLFSALIFAFSKPYLSNHKIEKASKTILYLDNSLSTNSKGKKGNLLRNAAKEIIDNSKENEIYTLLTNSDTYQNITNSELKNKLIQLKNTPSQLTLKAILLNINSEKKSKTNTLHKIALISDFQLTNNKNNPSFTNVNHPISLVKLNTEIKHNLSIDSIFISDQNSLNFTVQVVVSNQGEAQNDISISVLNKGRLASKRSFSIAENSNKIIDFKLENKGAFLGEIHLAIEDAFSFDNRFYFTHNLMQKTKVLSIGKSSPFLSKIFTKGEFIFSENSIQNVSYSSLAEQQLIILNELKNIPTILSTSIKEFVNNGGHLAIIPNETINLTNYNQFLKQLNFGTIQSKNKNALKITTINTQHPVFKNVFSKKINNFEYPTASSSYRSKVYNGTEIIGFENNQSFVTSLNNTYLFASSLKAANSNFINSPLIVPLFYTIGKLSFQNSPLYFRTASKNSVDIPIQLNKNDLLTVSNHKKTFIPLQQHFQNKVTLTIDNQDLGTGFYSILNQNDTLQTIAINQPKSESILQFLDFKQLKQPKNVVLTDNIASLFQKLNSTNKVLSLWKWFLALAIVSLLFEILILKFFKE